jgi:hypothetical protein
MAICGRRYTGRGPAVEFKSVKPRRADQGYMARWILRGSLPLALAAMTCACAAFGVPTQKGYDQVLRTWYDEPTSDLLARWGQPDKRYQNADGTTIFLYSRETDNITDLQGDQPQVQAQNVIGAGASALELFEAAKRQQEYRSVLIVHRCITLFNVNRGDIIREIAWIGNGCRAVPPHGSGPDAWSASARQLVSPHALGAAGPG